MALSSELSAQLQGLAADIVMVDDGSPAEEWAQLAELAGALSRSLADADLVAGADAAHGVSLICEKIAAGDIADTAAAREHLRALFQILEGLEEGVSLEEATTKLVIAQATRFLHDTESIEAPIPQAPPTVEHESLLEIEQRIDRLEQLLFSVAPGERDPETVRSVFREFHTLKGETGMLGLSDMMEYYHRIESAIETARQGELELTREVIDHLRELTEVGRLRLRGESEGKAAPSHYDPILEQLEAAARDAQTIGSPGEIFPVEVLEFEPVAAVSGAVRPTAPAADSTEPTVPKAGGVGRLQSVVLDVERLDALLERVNEVALIGTHLSESGMRDNETDREQCQELRRACRALQDLTSDLRMTAIHPIFQRVQRAAYEVARSRGRQIDISLAGTSTQLDRSAAEPLTAALIHCVRNAVDHGLESPEERRTSNKPESGRIHLEARRIGTEIEVAVADDGRGFDLAAIRTHAEALGRVTPGERLEDQHIVDLAFVSGLSTAGTVTDTSGRGVGMAVVQESVTALRGRTDIRTARGRGTRVRLRFPIALSAIDGFHVRVGRSVFVLPTQAIREAVRVRPDQVSTVVGQGTVVTIRGVVLPVLSLAQVLDVAGTSASAADGVLVVLEHDEALCAVWVDEVLDTRQVVVRPLEGNVTHSPLITGTILLPNRRVALALDSKGLLARTSVRAGAALTQAGSDHVRSGRTVDTVQIGSNQVGMIGFSLRIPDPAGHHRQYNFAINAFKVREFVPLRRLTQVARAPEGFAGVLLLRKRTVPIVSLLRLLDLVPADDEAARRSELTPIIVVCEFSGITVGFPVTEVQQVAYVSWDDILPPPATGGAFTLEYVVGTIRQSALVGSRVSQDGAVDQAAAYTASDDIALVLDFEALVGQVIRLYGDMDLEGIQRRKTRNRILLVEDSELIRRDMARALSAAGIEVLEAANGKEALDMIHELLAQAEAEDTSIFAYLDLVLSDIEMPQLDGYTLTAHIKQHAKLGVLPVLLHSSITNEAMVARGREVGADGFAPKCDPAELASQLRRYL